MDAVVNEWFWSIRRSFENPAVDLLLDAHVHMLLVFLYVEHRRIINLDSNFKSLIMGWAIALKRFPDAVSQITVNCCQSVVLEDENVLFFVFFQPVKRKPAADSNKRHPC